MRQRPYLSEHIFWINTTNDQDIAYIKDVCRQYPDFFRYLESKVPVDGNKSIGHFFQGCIDKNSIYIRFDDDICWLSDDAVKKITQFRINNPEYFIVFGNIINNALCNYIHQRIGALDLNIGEGHNLAYRCMDVESWSKGVVASQIHKAFLQKMRDGRINDYEFNKWILAEYERFSINLMAWFGYDFASFDGKVGYVQHGHPLWEEEPWLTEWKPKEIGRPNCIYGGALAAHFSFYPQREYLEDATDILEIYRELAHAKV